MIKLLKDSLQEGARLSLKFLIEVFNNAEEMKLIGKSESKELIVNEGLNRILNVMFAGTTQITTWYCVISESNTTPSLTMTYASPVFTEWTAYNEATRPEFVEAVSTSQQITNTANKAVFTANASKTLYGAGLVGGGSAPSTKGNTTGGGCLFDYGLFSTAQPVVNGNVVNLTVTISASNP